MPTIKRLVLEWGDFAWVVSARTDTHAPQRPLFTTQGGTLEQAVEMARDAAEYLELEWPAEKALEEVGDGA